MLRRYTEWLEAVIERVGGRNAFARLMGVNTNSVAQWRLGIAVPETYREQRLAEVTGEKLSIVKTLLDDARRQKAEDRRLALEVRATRIPFRNGGPRRLNGGAAAQATPAGRGQKRVPAQGSDAPRRRGRVTPRPSHSSLDERRLIGHYPWAA